MSSYQEYCSSMRESILSQTHMNRCNGLSFPPPSSITSEELDEWYDHLQHPNRWDDDLICAWDSQKIAMIENDFYPSREEEYDYFIRYIMTQKCNLIKTLVIDYDEDDYTTIYYNKSKWKDALLLYLYHMNKLGIRLSRSDLTVFQAILLGYTKESTFFAVYQLEDEDLIILLDELESIEWDQLRTSQKKILYTKFYTVLFTKRNLIEFDTLYEKFKNFITDYQDKLQHDPVMKAFAYGLD